MNDKLSFIYLEIPKFNKNANELETKFDKWINLLKRLEFLKRLPEELQHKIFKKVMSIAELLKLEKTDRKAYEESLKKHRDLKTAMDTQYMLGIEKGIEKGKREGIEQTSVMMLKAGISIETVSCITGLSIDQINALGD